MSPVGIRYVADVAPLIADPSWNHWITPLPPDTVSVWPTCTVPEIAITPLDDITAAVAADVAGELGPLAFEAITETVSVFPMSATTGT